MKKKNFKTLNLTCSSSECFDLISPRSMVLPDRLVPEQENLPCPQVEKAKAHEAEGNIRLFHVPKKNLLKEVREERSWCGLK